MSLHFYYLKIAITLLFIPLFTFLFLYNYIFTVIIPLHCYSFNRFITYIYIFFYSAFIMLNRQFSLSSTPIFAHTILYLSRYVRIVNLLKYAP